MVFSGAPVTPFRPFFEDDMSSGFDLLNIQLRQASLPAPSIDSSLRFSPGPFHFFYFRALSFHRLFAALKSGFRRRSLFLPPAPKRWSCECFVSALLQLEFCKYRLQMHGLSSHACTSPFFSLLLSRLPDSCPPERLLFISD